jgi:DNA helicase-2/ATP-dependent DNA helicase PcrA
MEHLNLFDLVTTRICDKPKGLPVEQCYSRRGEINGICKGYQKCRILEKSLEQLQYVCHDQSENSFLEACAGSGKTEVVGLKAAYEIKDWKSGYSGIAILTFTNNAADVIRERISQTTRFGYPHFVGTFDSWLHKYIANPFVHLYTKYKGKNGDRSIRLVDNRSRSDFLASFQLEHPIIEKTLPVKANEYSFNMAEDSFVFSSYDNLVDNLRNSSVLAPKQKQELRQLKERFWASGFANYQDVEYLSYEILDQRKNAADSLSQRFPLIIVDECQDLAWSQIQILGKLLEKGTKIHLIGDLNQAIYSFRKVDPQDVDIFIIKHNFKRLKLTQNFRSLQPIVDLSSKIVHQSNIKGIQYNQNKPTCICFEYKKAEIDKLPSLFVEYLIENGFELEKCAILTRNNNTVAKLRPGIRNDLKTPELLPVAIQIWGTDNITSEQIGEALSSVGKFIAHYYFAGVLWDHQNNHCPEGVKSNFKWRLFLSDILDKCSQDQDLSNLELVWETWSKHLRDKFKNIVRNCSEKYQIKINVDKAKAYRSPLGKENKSLSKEKVNSTIKIATRNSATGVRITNFHQVKGETLSTVMVVSSPTNQGEGYWKNWLEDPQSENARFAYVASTRPTNLLIWAVPGTLENQDIEQLQSLGFEVVKSLSPFTIEDRQYQNNLDDPQ